MAKINRSANFPNLMLRRHGYVSDVNVYLDRGGKGLNNSGKAFSIIILVMILHGT